MARIVLGVDFGTSVAKATLIDLETGTTNHYSERYANGAEQATPSGWTRVFLRCARNVVAELPDGVTVAGLAVTGMAPNVALVYPDGQEDCMLFCDRSAFDIERSLDERLGTPRWSNEVLSKILFLRDQRHKGTPRLFSTHNWLVSELTGQFVVDGVTASECGVLISPEGWDAKRLDEFRLPRSTFPKIVAPTDVIGTVPADFQLPALRGAKVVAGSTDTLATAVGAGWQMDETLLVYYGTFNCAAKISGTRDEVLSRSIPKNPFEWILSIPRAGDQVLQVANMLFGHLDSRDRLVALERAGAGSPPGANGLVFLHSSNLDATTVSSPPVATIPWLRHDHTSGDLSRSVMEGFGYSLRRALMCREPRDRFSNVVAAGGGAGNSAWRQMVSDITELVQHYRPTADRGFGSAAIAAIGIGEVDPTLDMHGGSTPTIPSAHDKYEEAFVRYVQACTDYAIIPLNG